MTLTFGLLTWISIGVIYSSRTIYLPSLKLLGQSVLELSVAQGEVDWHDLWPWPTDLTIKRDHLLIKDYLPTKFEVSWGKRSWVISCTRWSRLAWPLTLTFDLLTWLSIGIIYSSRTIYLPSWSFWGKAFLSYQLHKVKGYRPTGPTDIPTDMCKAICPSFFKGGGIINNLDMIGSRNFTRRFAQPEVSLSQTTIVYRTTKFISVCHRLGIVCRFGFFFCHTTASDLFPFFFVGNKHNK